MSTPIAEDSKHVSLSSIIGKAASAAIVGIVLFFGMKSCVSTAWVSPGETLKYTLVGEDDRAMAVYFLPKNRMVVAYEDPAEPTYEVLIMSVYGIVADHYLGPIWKHEEDILGWEWVRDGTDPVKFYVTVKDKIHVGRGETSFPPIGKEKSIKARIGEGKLKIFGMTLEKSTVTLEDELFLSDFELDSD